MLDDIREDLQTSTHRRNSSESLSKQSLWEICRKSSSDLISLIFI